MTGSWYEMHGDAVEAAAHLADRAGAKDFELGFIRDNVPIEEAGWYAHASYQGARIFVEERRSPSEAALAFAERMLRGAQCRCRQVVTLVDGQPGCRWQLLGKRWEPGCDAPPLDVTGARGDHAALARALAALAEAPPANRAERRKARKRGSR